MNAYVVTEGQADVDLLRCVLPGDLRAGVEVVAGGGSYAVISLARSLLVRRRVPVAIVINAGSVSPEITQERRQSAEESVASVAATIPVKVVVAVPELEVVFFEDESLLQRMFGRSIAGEILALAAWSPRNALKQLFDQPGSIQSQAELIRSLTPADIEVLQEAAPLQELIEFLHQARELSSAKVSAA